MSDRVTYYTVTSSPTMASTATGEAYGGATGGRQGRTIRSGFFREGGDFLFLCDVALIAYVSDAST
jgi:hypothetical protein